MLIDNPAITHCYCNQFNYAEQFEEKSFCRDYMWAAVSADAMTLAAGLGVAMINQALSVLVRKLGVLECHHSLNSRESSTFFRVFLLNFINTGRAKCPQTQRHTQLFAKLCQLCCDSRDSAAHEQ